MRPNRHNRPWKNRRNRNPTELKDSLGGDIITLSIQKTEDITDLISKIEHVKEVKKQNDSYIIKAANCELAAPLIIEALRNNNHIVTKLSLTKPTLNEVYLQYTGKSMRDAEESREGVMQQRMAMRRAR